MINLHVLINNTLDENQLGCKVQKFKRDAQAKLSISYFLHPSVPVEYANDKPISIEHEVQIDIWGDYEVSIHNTTEKVIALMREKGFGLVLSRQEEYDDETGIIHKPIIFNYYEKLKGGI